MDSDNSRSARSLPSQFRARHCILRYIILPFMTIPQCQDTRTATFCDTAAKCQSAAAAFETSPALALDCEGHNLGISSGRFSITPSAAWPLTPKPISLMCSGCFPPPSSPFLIFCVRRISERLSSMGALYHELGIELQNVLDLQLVDIMSRFERGEGWETQWKRLQSCLNTD